MEESKFDYEKMCATLCAANANSAEKRLKDQKSVLEQLLTAAVKKSKSFRLSESTLPKHWGVENNAVNTHWSQVTSLLFHEPIHMELLKLQQMMKLNTLRKATLPTLQQFKQWLITFGLLVRQILLLKQQVQKERILSGFQQQVQTEFSSFWILFEKLIQTISQLTSVATTREFSSKITYMEHEINAVTEDTINMCNELELCLRQDSSLTSSILMANFNEEDEHEAVLSVLLSAIKSPQQGLVVASIFNATHHWLGADDRSKLDRCISAPFRWVIDLFYAKEYKEFDSLLKCVYSNGSLFHPIHSRSFKHIKTPNIVHAEDDSYIVFTPRGESTCDFAAMAV